MPPLVDFPCSLPTAIIPAGIDATAISSEYTSELGNLSAEHFTDDAIWKDVYALTGTLRTFYSSSSISKAWKETTTRAQTHSFVLDPKSVRVARLPGGAAWIEAVYSFETSAIPRTSCSAIVGLMPGADGKWRIWVLRTILEQLQSDSNVDKLKEVCDSNTLNAKTKSTHFDCVVIGGGQAGLSMGGRLKAMGVSYAVLDKYREVGDSWKSRYGSVRLHTTREYAHLPFDRTFPDQYQEWLTKDDLAQGYQDWVKKYGIDVWTGTKARKGTWDVASSSWVLEIEQEDRIHSITCSFIVLAGGGGSQVPVMPEYLCRDAFEGDVLHSAEYKDASNWKGKHGIVVGTANTAHDIAEDMLDAGCASVTMIQRSTSLLYNSILPTSIADRAFLTQPYAIADLVSKDVLHSMAAAEPERYAALARAGFKVDPFGSITYQLYERFGGHYVDIGASAKIATGLIKVKSDGLPTRYTKSGVLFEDGTELRADAIVFATGFKGNMRYLVEEIFGPAVAEQMGDFWGLDKWGEIKGAFKPGGHPGLWYHGGTIGQARYMSRFIAMSIKAQMLGTPLTRYEETP